MDISDSGNLEALLDCCFNFIWARPFPAQEPSIITKGLQREWQLSQFVRKSSTLGKCRAWICVYKNRSGRRIRIDARERVVCKEDAVFRAYTELLQTGPARAISGGCLNVRGMSILGRFVRAANLLADGGVDWDGTKSGHVSSFAP
jgi:hypothetical protein